VFHTGAKSIPAIAIVASFEFPIGIGGTPAEEYLESIRVATIVRLIGHAAWF
jgi:hypothetical protein